jgi:hypothetical protein
MGAEAGSGQVIVTVNEDSKSSLYTVSGGTVTHYAYTPSLPHLGGTDAVAVYNGKILISASAPGTDGKAPASAPAVFAVTLNAGAKTAAVAPFFADNATATGVNGSSGKKVILALTDPESDAVVPSTSPKFDGDLVLNSLGTIDLTTGKIGAVTTDGGVMPKGPNLRLVTGSARLRRGRAVPVRLCRAAVRAASGQEIAAFTSSTTFFSTAGVHSARAYDTGQMSPSSRFADSWKPRVE